ncbi:MAG: NAD kinase, partial [Gammaproteobacteria bacterium]|nr:NAD kinase [Gammaproteobacteria bacterium]
MFQKIGIFGKYNGIQSWETIDKLVQHLQAKSKTIYLDSASCKDFPHEQYDLEIIDRDQLADHIEV